jgi:hypothetical protein
VAIQKVLCVGPVWDTRQWVTASRGIARPIRIRGIRIGTEQFQYIHGRVRDLQNRCQPVASVDTKKKELVGDFKNGDREWCPQGNPEPVVRLLEKIT